MLPQVVTHLVGCCIACCESYLSILYQRLQLLLEISKDEVTVLSHTLLRLITGSGVDWSKDEELSKRVLKLGLVSSYL